MLTTPKTPTAAELYERNSDFRSFIGIWVSERRCPLPVVDLLENDLPVAAEACRWAATERDRPVYYPAKEVGERGGKCGPYPTANNTLPTEPQEWFWSNRWVYK